MIGERCGAASHAVKGSSHSQCSLPLPRSRARASRDASTGRSTSRRWLARAPRTTLPARRVKIAAALTLAALFARVLRARASAGGPASALGRRAGARDRRRVLRQGCRRASGRLRFVATSLVYLVHADADSLAAGRWHLLAPWLHTYALPVFAVSLAERRARVAVRRLAARDRGVRRSHARAGSPRADHGRTIRRGSRTRSTTGTAPPFRARVRVAASSAPHLTRGPRSGPRASSEETAQGRRTQHHLCAREPVRGDAGPRAHAVSFVGPAVAAAGSSGRSCSRTGVTVLHPRGQGVGGSLPSRRCS